MVPKTNIISLEQVRRVTEKFRALSIRHQTPIVLVSSEVEEQSSCNLPKEENRTPPRPESSSPQGGAPFFESLIVIEIFKILEIVIKVIFQIVLEIRIEFWFKVLCKV